MAISYYLDHHPAEIAKGNPNDVHRPGDLQANALSPPPIPLPPSHFSGDHIHHNIKYLEQLLDSSLATVAVVQFSGNTLADVLTPRAYDTLKALAALEASVSSTKPRGSDLEVPNRSTFPDIGTSRIHLSISMNDVVLFLWAGLVALSLSLLFFYSPQLCEMDVSCFFLKKQGIYTRMLTSCAFI